MQAQLNFHGASLHPENNRESEMHLENNSEHFDNQCELVLNLLQKGERLTVRDALINYNIGHLPRRIKDIKDNLKINIKSQMIGRGFKEYYL